MSKGIVLGPGAARGLANLLSQGDGPPAGGPPDEYRRFPMQGLIEGILDGHLEAAAADGATETTATLSVWRGGAARWADSLRNVTVTNRSDGLWLPSGSVVQCARISNEWRPLVPFSIVLGKTDAAHAKNASGTISVWAGTTPGGVTDTTKNITAFNRFANINSGKWVLCVGFYWGFEILAAECTS